MENQRRIWLIDNSASGSNSDKALDLLEETCGDAGFHVAHRTMFPRYELPSPAMLDAAGIDLLAIFAGDGTINSAISGLAGWGGEVLVLPGGTMNLLYHRLHGDREMEEVITAAAAGETVPARPSIVRGPSCDAFAGLMAGPGTSWSQVREAMRDTSIIEMAEHTVQAVEASFDGAMIACTDPPLGRREGYPLILLNPHEKEMEVLAYYAETPPQYLEQAFALIRRDFRSGPHDELGRTPRLRLASTDRRPFGLLVDGEPAEAEKHEAEFVLGAAEVDLLATEPDFWGK